MLFCRVDRRDVLRSSAILAGMTRAPLTGTGRAFAAAVRPVNLELVTLAETSAILTWYTGSAGTDDGLGRMPPAAAGEVQYGPAPGGSPAPPAAKGRSGRQ